MENNDKAHYSGGLAEPVSATVEITASANSKPRFQHFGLAMQGQKEKENKETKAYAEPEERVRLVAE